MSRIYTDLAVIDVTKDGFVAIEIMPGLSLAELSNMTDAVLRDGRVRSAA